MEQPSQKGPAWSRRSGTHLSLNLQSDLGQRLPEIFCVSLSYSQPCHGDQIFHVAAASEPRGARLFFLNEVADRLNCRARLLFPPVLWEVREWGSYGEE